MKFSLREVRPVPEDQWVELGKAVLYQVPVTVLFGTIFFVGMLIGGFPKRVLGAIGLLGIVPVIAWFNGFTWFRPRLLGILIGMFFSFFSLVSIILWTLALLEMTVGLQGY